MFTLIDNYDSFTWNLWHFLSDLGAEVEIIRNDATTVAGILDAVPQGIIISPGPGTPEDAGITIDLIRAARGRVPVLGVCLGHQALAVAFGGRVKRFDPPVHGKLSLVARSHSNAVRTDIFSGCPEEFPVTRYHSLGVEEDSLPPELTVTARTAAGAIMGISHVDADLHGVQFHPLNQSPRLPAIKFWRISSVSVARTSPIPKRWPSLRTQILRLDQRFPDQMHV